jgi:hypothetical protein
MQAFILFLKTIPILKDFFDKFVEYWLYQQDLNDEKIMLKKVHQREAIFKSLQNPNLSNDERSALRRMLYDINKN